MFYDPLAPCRDAGDGCDTPDTDNGNQNGGNGTNDPSTPDSPISPAPPSNDQNGNDSDAPTLPVDAIDPKLLALAMAFVPYQSWETPYATDVALSRGTIFPGLDKPFLGEPPVSDSPSLRWGG